MTNTEYFIVELLYEATLEFSDYKNIRLDRLVKQSRCELAMALGVEDIRRMNWNSQSTEKLT